MCEVNTIKVIDALEGLRQLPDNFIQCCVTSPPYWRQRDYGIPAQLGMEPTPELYIDSLTSVFDEVRRTLKPDGVLWLNLGDCYWGSGKAGNNPAYQQRHTEFGKPSTKNARFGKPTTGQHPYLKPKDLIGLPWRVALAMQKQGWYLRQDIIWSKSNGMPESITDRCTRVHEYIFMFSKNARYYYDASAIKKPMQISSFERQQYGFGLQNKHSGGIPGQGLHGFHRHRESKQTEHGKRYDSINDRNKTKSTPTLQKANRRSVWTISTANLKERHYATFPLEIPDLCIKAGSRSEDIVLDPFMGAGTTALAAALLQRKFIGFELNPDYAAIACRRLRLALGLFCPLND